MRFLTFALVACLVTAAVVPTVMASPADAFFAPGSDGYGGPSLLNVDWGTIALGVLAIISGGILICQGGGWC